MFPIQVILYILNCLLLLLVFLYQAVKDFDILKMWLSKDDSFGAILLPA